MTVTLSSGTNAGRATNVEGRNSALVKITFDSSYPTGGEELAGLVPLIGFTPAIVFVGQTGTAAGYTFSYVPATNKLMAFWVDTSVDGAVMSEVANTTNLSAVSVHLLIYGD